MLGLHITVINATQLKKYLTKYRVDNGW